MLNYEHLADLQKTLLTTDLRKRKQLSFDKTSPHDLVWDICVSDYSFPTD